MDINDIIPESYVKDLSEKIWNEMKENIEKDVCRAINENLKWRVHSALRDICSRELNKVIHSCVDQKIKDMEQEIFSACEKGLSLLKENLTKEVIDRVVGQFNQWDVSNKVRDMVNNSLKTQLGIDIK